MARRRRRSSALREYIEGGSSVKTKTLNTATEEDCRIFAYYLYVICDYKVKNYADQEETSEFLGYLFRMFTRLSKKLGVEEAVSQQLKKMVLRYARNGGLTIYADLSNSNSDSDAFRVSRSYRDCLDDTDIPYEYFERKGFVLDNDISPDNFTILKNINK